MNPGTLPAADGFALAMVVILSVSLGIVALLAVGIYRSGKRRESEVEKLLDELRREEEDEKHPASPAGDDKQDPWEKDPEWWRQ